jgi:hypothetical protein
MMRAEKLMWFSVLGLLAAACGGDDEGGGNASPQSYEAITESMAQPSGTVDENTAGDIGEEFEKVSGAAPAGVREDQVAQSSGSQTIQCSGGGSISVTASGSESAGSGTFSYNDCCESSCCLEGSGSVYYSSASTAEFTYCGSYDIDATCGGTSSSVNFSGCLGSDLEWSYLITVDGETYSVSGTYSDGDGTLEIRGANGNWTCTYTDGSGSCTGTGGTSGSFSFSS